MKKSLFLLLAGALVTFLLGACTPFSDHAPNGKGRPVHIIAKVSSAVTYGGTIEIVACDAPGCKSGGVTFGPFSETTPESGLFEGELDLDNGIHYLNASYTVGGSVTHEVQNVQFEITDEDRSITLYLSNLDATPFANHAPRYVSATPTPDPETGGILVPEGQSVTLTATFDDVDHNSPLTFTWTSQRLFQDPSPDPIAHSGAVTDVPDAQNNPDRIRSTLEWSVPDAGDYVVTVIAEDQKGARAGYQFYVTLNGPPRFSARFNTLPQIDNIAINYGAGYQVFDFQPIELTVSATDAENDTIQIVEATSDCVDSEYSGATFSPDPSASTPIEICSCAGTASIYFTPSIATSSCTVMLTVTDGHGGFNTGRVEFPVESQRR